MGDLSPNFSREEFACKHCGVCAINILTVDALQKLRYKLGVPLYVTSGYRCWTHNKASGGAEHSRHPLGWAVDVTSRHIDPATIGKAAKELGLFTEIRVYPDDNFVHLGVL